MDLSDEAVRLQKSVTFAPPGPDPLAVASNPVLGTDDFASASNFASGSFSSSTLDTSSPHGIGISGLIFSGEAEPKAEEEEEEQVEPRSFMDLLIDCCSTQSSLAFQAKQSGEPGLQIDDFVGLFSGLMYGICTVQEKQKLNDAAEFSALKAFLYVTFRSMDRNNDGVVNWNDVVGHVIDERVEATRGDVLDAGFTFAKGKIWRFDPAASSRLRPPKAQNLEKNMVGIRQRVLARKVENRAKCTAGGRKRASAGRGRGVENEHLLDPDDELFRPEGSPQRNKPSLYAERTRKEAEGKQLAVELDAYADVEVDDFPYAAVHYMRLWDDWDRMVVLSRPNDVSLVNTSNMAIVAPIVTESPVLAVESVKHLGNVRLLITTHKDHSVRAWTVRERGVFEITCDYSYTCSEEQCSVKSCPSKPHVIFTGGAGGELRQWNISPALLEKFRIGDPDALQTITTKTWESGELHSQAVTDILFLPNDGPLVSASLDGKVIIQDVDHETQFRVLRHNRGIFSMCYNDTAQVLVAVGYEFTPYVWDASSRNAIPTKLEDHCDPHKHTLISVKAIKNSTLVVTVDASGKVKFWDLRSGKCTQTLLTENHTSAHAQGKAHLSTYAVEYHPSTNRVYVAGKALTCLCAITDSNPYVSCDTEVIAVSFDERTGQIYTAHPRSVAVWDALQGCIVSMLPFQAPKMESFGGEEKITAMVVVPKGRKYCLGTSSGRLTVHKSTNGDCMQATPRVHDVEVGFMVYGEQVNDVEYVLSVGRDGSCFVLTESENIPKTFTLLPSVPRCGVFSSRHSVLALGTLQGQLLIVDPGSVLTRGPLAKDTIPETEEVTSVCVLDRFPVVAVACDGFVAFWGLKGASVVGKELERSSYPSHRDNTVAITAMASCKSFTRCFLFCGDEVGRITFYTITASIEKGRNARARLRGYSSVRQFHVCRVHADEIRALEVVPRAAVIISVSWDRVARITNYEGVPLGELNQGRGLTSVRWTKGQPPAYQFPQISFRLAGDEARAERTVDRIQQFFRILRRKAAERRANPLKFASAGSSDEEEEEEEESLRLADAFDRSPGGTAIIGGEEEAAADQEETPAESSTTQGDKVVQFRGRTSRRSSLHQTEENLDFATLTMKMIEDVGDFDDHAQYVTSTMLSGSERPSSFYSEESGSSDSGESDAISPGGTSPDVWTATNSPSTGKRSDVFEMSTSLGRSRMSKSGKRRKRKKGKDRVMRTPFLKVPFREAPGTPPEKTVVPLLAPHPPTVGVNDGNQGRNLCSNIPPPACEPTMSAGPSYAQPTLSRSTQQAALADHTAGSQSPAGIRSRNISSVGAKTARSPGMSTPGKRSEDRPQSAQTARQPQEGAAAPVQASVNTSQLKPGQRPHPPRRNLSELTSSFDNLNSSSTAGGSLRKPPTVRPPEEVHRPGITRDLTGGKRTTEARILRYVGQLVVVQHEGGKTTSEECSSRRVVTTMTRQYREEDAKRQHKRTLVGEELRLRHSVGADDLARHKQIVAEMSAMEKEEKEAAVRKEAERQRRLAGGPMPDHPRSRRAPKRD